MRRSWLQLFVALGCAGSPARQGAPPPLKLTIVGINDTHGDPRSAPAGAIVVKMVDDPSGQVLCETRSCTVRACAASCAPGTYPVSLPDFLADGGDGLTMLTDVPRRSGGVSTRDQIVAYVKEHRPLTAELLGAASSGKEPRWTQMGSARRKQAGE